MWLRLFSLFCQHSLLHAAGLPLCERPALLLLLSDSTLLVYQAHLTASRTLSFRRLHIDWLPCLVQQPTEGASDSASVLRHANAVTPSSRIARFEQLGELTFSAGIFIMGAHPAWLIASRWGCGSFAWGQAAWGGRDGLLFARHQLARPSWPHRHWVLKWRHPPPHCMHPGEVNAIAAAESYRVITPRLPHVFPP